MTKITDHEDPRILMGRHLCKELVLQALDMTLAQRHAEGAINHSDQGCQYPLDRVWAALS
ncbi:hypothetical protein [Burkholderia cepacia]|uniref:hypothetical protein n=1 Tax=Burkholderia cepacia TaxID=292 RepID=UPI0039A47BCB